MALHLAHASDKNNRDSEAVTCFDNKGNNIMGIHLHNVNNMRSRENPSCAASSTVFNYITMDAILTTKLGLTHLQILSQTWTLSIKTALALLVIRKKANT